MTARRSGCVEVTADAEGFHVRDARAGAAGVTLTMTPSEWLRFCTALLADEVRDTPVRVEHLCILVAADGRFSVSVPGIAVLRFTAADRVCFLDGLRRGQFSALAFATV